MYKFGLDALWHDVLERRHSSILMCTMTSLGEAQDLSGSYFIRQRRAQLCVQPRTAMPVVALQAPALHGAIFPPALDPCPPSCQSHTLECLSLGCADVAGSLLLHDLCCTTLCCLCGDDSGQKGLYWLYCLQLRRGHGVLRQRKVCPGVLKPESGTCWYQGMRAMRKSHCHLP